VALAPIDPTRPVVPVVIPCHPYYPSTASQTEAVARTPYVDNREPRLLAGAQSKIRSIFPQGQPWSSALVFRRQDGFDKCRRERRVANEQNRKTRKTAFHKVRLALDERSQGPGGPGAVHTCRYLAAGLTR
jgi:hypothetical protein